MLLLTLPGTVFLYYGDELGLPSISCARTRCTTLTTHTETGATPIVHPCRGTLPRGQGSLRARRTCRTRRRCAGATWRQRVDAGSILNLYHQLTQLRREVPALAGTTLGQVRGEDRILSFIRPHAERPVQVVLNFASTATTFRLPRPGQILLSTYLNTKAPCGPDIQLRPDEGLVIALEPQGPQGHSQ